MTPNSPRKKKVLDDSHVKQKETVGISDKKNVIDALYIDDDGNDDTYNHAGTEAWKCAHCFYPHNTTPCFCSSCGSVYIP